MRPFEQIWRWLQTFFLGRRWVERRWEEADGLQVTEVREGRISTVKVTGKILPKLRFPLPEGQRHGATANCLLGIAFPVEPLLQAFRERHEGEVLDGVVRGRGSDAVALVVAALQVARALQVFPRQRRLAAIVAGSGNARTRAAALEALLFADPFGAETRAAARRASDDPDASIRLGALSARVDAGEQDNFQALFLALAGDPDAPPTVRLSALAELRAARWELRPPRAPHYFTGVVRPSRSPLPLVADAWLVVAAAAADADEDAAFILDACAQGPATEAVLVEALSRAKKTTSKERYLLALGTLGTGRSAEIVRRLGADLARELTRSGQAPRGPAVGSPVAPWVFSSERFPSLRRVSRP